MFAQVLWHRAGVLSAGAGMHLFFWEGQGAGFNWDPFVFEGVSVFATNMGRMVNLGKGTSFETQLCRHEEP